MFFTRAVLSVYVKVQLYSRDVFHQGCPVSTHVMFFTRAVLSVLTWCFSPGLSCQCMWRYSTHVMFFTRAVLSVYTHVMFFTRAVLSVYVKGEGTLLTWCFSPGPSCPCMWRGWDGQTWHGTVRWRRSVLPALAPTFRAPQTATPPLPSPPHL